MALFFVYKYLVSTFCFYGVRGKVLQFPIQTAKPKTWTLRYKLSTILIILNIKYFQKIKGLESFWGINYIKYKILSRYFLTFSLHIIFLNTELNSFFKEAF